MAAATRRVLILGGTGQALDLAARLVRRQALQVTSALAGRTRRPRLPPGRVRIGGFGGQPGLARYLRERRIDLLLDATHPFAARISRNAAGAAAACAVPLLVLGRPAAPPAAGISEAPDLEGALQAARALGRRALATFRLDLTTAPRLAEQELIVRAIEPPKRAPPAGVRWLLARAPFDAMEERRLLERLAIDVVIAKASGPAAAAKLAAAQAVGCKVVLIRRPPAPAAGVAVDSVADAVRWVESQAFGRST